MLPTELAVPLPTLPQPNPPLPRAARITLFPSWSVRLYGWNPHLEMNVFMPGREAISTLGVIAVPPANMAESTVGVCVGSRRGRALLLLCSHQGEVEGKGPLLQNRGFCAASSGLRPHMGWVHTEGMSGSPSLATGVETAP